MKYQGIIKKSRTLDAAMFIGVFGAAQLALPGLGLDPQVSGVVNMVLAIVVAVLRYKTTGPVGEK